jgi:glycosyltransferase involved in cell wall biosynthesis
VVVHRFKPLVRVGNAPLLPQLRRLRDASLIHLHHPFYAGAEFVALSGRPYVVTYHQDVQLSGVKGWATSLHDRTIGRAILKRAARLCPTTLDYARHSALANQFAQLSDRVTPLPNGVDVSRYQPGPVDLAVRRRVDLSDTGVVVLFVGAMDHAHYFKGVPTLLHALTRTPGASALLVGEGDLRPSYQRLAVELGLGGRAAFVGRVPESELPGIYRAADVLVLPSETRGEAFGMVLLEAMASGRPVIATDLPGVRSVVSHGEDGFLVVPGDALALGQAILKVVGMSGEARMAMGAAGRRKVEASYAWERIGERLESLYVDVLAERAVQGAGNAT